MDHRNKKIYVILSANNVDFHIPVAIEARVNADTTLRVDCFLLWKAIQAHFPVGSYSEFFGLELHRKSAVCL